VVVEEGEGVALENVETDTVELTSPDTVFDAELKELPVCEVDFVGVPVRADQVEAGDAVELGEAVGVAWAKCA